MFNNIVSGTLAGLAAKGTLALGSLLIIPLMLKQLGSTNYGIWITISSTVGLMSFMDLGIGSNLMNYIAKAGNDEKSITKYINLAYRIQFIFIGIICLTFTAFFNYINWNEILNLQTSSTAIFQAIFFTFFFFFFSLVSNTIYSIERGLQRSDIANIWQLISSISYLSCLYLVLLFSPNITSVAIITFGIPVFIAIINSIWFLNKKSLIHFKTTNFNLSEARDFISNSAGFLYLQIAGLIAFQTDALIIAHILNFEEVSKYYITTRIFYIPTIILNVYLQTLWPAYAEASAKSNWLWIKNTFYKNIIWSLLLVSIFVLAIYLLQKPIFTSWLHHKIDIPKGLIIACAAWALINNCIDIHLATLLNGLNILKIQAISAGLMITANIGLSIFLAHKIGVAGVVWGTAISTLLFSSFPLFIYTKKLLKRNANLVLQKN